MSRRRYLLDAKTGMFTARDGQLLTAVTGRVVGIILDEVEEERGFGGEEIPSSTTLQAVEEDLSKQSRDGGLGETGDLDLVAELWAYYQRVIPEARGWLLNRTRRQVIQRSLKAVGAKKFRVSVEAPIDDPSVAAFNKCCRAVDGLAASPWHNGENDERRKWLEIRYALRGNSAKGQSDDERVMSMAALAPSAGLHLPPGVSQEKVDRRVEEIRVWHRSGGTFEPGRAAQAREELQAWGFEVELLDGPPYVKLAQRGRRE